MPRKPSIRKSVTNDQAQNQQREVEYRESSNFTSLYSNNVSLKLTPWDVQLVFGKILSLDTTKMVIENEVSVYVSPQTAKSLLKVLTGIVQQYEDKIGEIKYGED
jgi:hypothetical protein